MRGVWDGGALGVGQAPRELVQHHAEHRGAALPPQQQDRRGHGPHVLAGQAGEVGVGRGDGLRVERSRVVELNRADGFRYLVENGCARYAVYKRAHPRDLVAAYERPGGRLPGVAHERVVSLLSARRSPEPEQHRRLGQGQRADDCRVAHRAGERGERAVG